MDEMDKASELRGAIRNLELQIMELEERVNELTVENNKLIKESLKETSAPVGMLHKHAYKQSKTSSY